MSDSSNFRSFANAAAEKAKGFALFAANKTKKVSRIAKLNVEISNQKDTIKHAYAEIGKLYYEAHHDAPEGFFQQLCQEIDLAMAEIAAKEAEIAELKADDEPAEADDFEAVVDQTEAEAEVSDADIDPETIFTEVSEPVEAEDDADIEVEIEVTGGEDAPEAE